MPKVIKDPVHGFIEISDEELKIIDTWEFQRLRYIRQLGTTYMVYPSANHTRFEHSLGTLYVAKKFLKRNFSEFIDNEKRKLFYIASLLHDIGHTPFSHCLESLLDCSHEEMGREIIRNSEIKDILEENGIDSNKVCEILAGETELSPLIASQVDVDKLDYLLRDSIHTGLGYGMIALDRILYATEITENGIIFSKKALIALENLFLARYQMYMSVYFHHTAMYFTHLLKIIVEKFTKEGLLPEFSKSNLKEFINITDNEILYLIKQNSKRNDILGSLCNKFIKRKKYKKIIEVIKPNLEYKTIKELEKRIYEEFPKEYVFFTYPSLSVYKYSPSYEEFPVYIKIDGELKYLHEVSNILRKIMNENYLIIRVFVDKEKINDNEIDKLLKIIQSEILFK